MRLGSACVLRAGDGVSLVRTFAVVAGVPSAIKGKCSRHGAASTVIVCRSWPASRNWLLWRSVSAGVAAGSRIMWRFFGFAQDRLRSPLQRYVP